MTYSPESSPLLPSRNPTARTPLPKAQLSVLIAVRIANHVAYLQISPYINQFLVYLGVAKPDNVGFYSGIMETTYSVAKMLSVYHWGWISDIVGRRPVVLIGVVGIAAATTVFGMSTSFFGILGSKFLSGFFEGNTAVVHSFLVEIADETNQDIVIPMYSLAWPIACIIGPLIGGKLANAATRYPEYFSWNIFLEHPYLPPCLVSTVFALGGAGLGFVFMAETLPSKRNSGVGTSSSECSVSESYTTQDGPTSLTISELLSVPAIHTLAISGFALSSLSSALDVVLTLFCYSAVESGGLGLEPSTIGNFLAFGGVLSLLRFLVMPSILRNFDYAKTYHACMLSLPLAFASLPILNAIARYQFFGARAMPSMWILLVFVLALSKTTGIAYSISMLLIKQHTPTPSLLGQSNGIVEFAMSVGSAVGPVVVSTLFTVWNGEWVRERGVGWTWGWAVLMVCLSLVGARVTKELVKWS